jgi:predicted O-methyltransferase YrrM
MKAMASAFVSLGALIGFPTVSLRFLVTEYPAEQTDWGAVGFYTASLLGISAVLICVGTLIAFFGENQTKKRIRLASLLFAILAFGAVGLFSNSIPRETTISVPSSEYEFTTDWVSNNIGYWQQMLGPMRGDPVSALEIGSYEGRSAIWFLGNVLVHPNSSLTCVDLFTDPTIEGRFDRNIKTTGVASKVIKIKARSDEALKRLPNGSFDLIYIDGSHQAKDVMVDAVLAWELLKPGGIVIFDDYQWSGYGRLEGRFKTPKLAIDGFLDVYLPQAEVLHKGYQIALRKKEFDRIDLREYYGTLGRLSVALQQTLFLRSTPSTP